MKSQSHHGTSGDKTKTVGINPHMDRVHESSFFQGKGAHRSVSLLSGQKKNRSFCTEYSALPRESQLELLFCASKSSFKYYKFIMKCNNLCFHLNQYTAIRSFKINIPKETSVGLWSLLVFSFIQVTPFIFGIFFLLKGGVGCMSFFNLNF